MELGFRVEVVEGDALEFPADVLMVKDAPRSGGLDARVRKMFKGSGTAGDNLEPGDYRLIEIKGSLTDRVKTNYVLRVGSVSIFDLDYGEIRKLGHNMLAALHDEGAAVKQAVTTLHGVNTALGNDEEEAFRSLLLGFADAFEEKKVPQSLESVTIIDREAFRIQLMRESLDKFIPPQKESLDPKTAERRTAAEQEAAEVVSQMIAGVGSFSQPYQKPVADATSPHVFVAMPFADEFDDQYYLGIRPAVTSNDLLCVRLDQDEAVFTGDIMDQVKTRIRDAKLMIALLDDKNPNVYLEVGYAWGVGTPTILILHEDEEAPFDVQGARLLLYKHIWKLKEQLTDEVRSLLGF